MTPQSTQENSAPSASAAQDSPEQSVAPLFAPTGLASAVGLPMLAWDKDGTCRAWNRPAEELFGYSAAEIIGASVTTLVAPEISPRIEQIISELFQYGKPVFSANENRTKDGRIIWCEWRNSPMWDAFGEIVAGVSIARDLTRHRRIEQEREHLQTIAAAANAPSDLEDVLLLVRQGFLSLGGFDRAGIWLVEGETIHGTWGTDENGNLTDERHCSHTLATYALPKFCEMHGGRIYFIIKSDIYVTGHGDCITIDPPIDLAGIALRVRGEMLGIIYFDNLLTRRPIHAADIEEIMPFADQAGVAIANARLLIERERMINRRRSLLETATAINADLSLDEILLLVRNAVVEGGDFDRAGIYTLDNETIYGGWGTDEQGRPKAEHDFTIPRVQWEQFLTPFESSAIQYQLLNRDGSDETNPTAETTSKALVALRAGGDLVGLLFVDNLISGRAIREENVALLLGLTEQAAASIRNIRLIAELRQTQDALIRSEKLRAVGELASGVAHNVNNVLAAVLGYAELIQDTEGVSAEICEFARTIERAAMDGAEIVRRIQSFARRETEARQAVFDLCQITREAIDLTRPAWLNQAASRGAKIEIIPIMFRELPAMGVASEIREVLVNLIRNAVDAMPNGGLITVRCVAEGGMAQVSIADTGTGMDAATKQRVFEPFFTTKGVGLGTGLGLSVAWGILARHQGRIEVDSEPGSGSIFRILLPLCNEQIKKAGAAENLSLEGRRLLIVEDETFVLEGLARTLMARKAKVHMTESAEEALVWLRTHAGECDIVISDHGMVGMTGLQLLAVIAERYPAIRRVLLSGWGAAPPGGVSTDSAEQILAKPVRAEVLIAALAPLTRRIEETGKR